MQTGDHELYFPAINGKAYCCQALARFIPAESPVGRKARCRLVNRPCLAKRESTFMKEAEKHKSSFVR